MLPCFGSNTHKLINLDVKHKENKMNTEHVEKISGEINEQQKKTKTSTTFINCTQTEISHSNFEYYNSTSRS